MIEKIVLRKYEKETHVLERLIAQAIDENSYITFASIACLKERIKWLKVPYKLYQIDGTEKGIIIYEKPRLQS